MSVDVRMLNAGERVLRDAGVLDARRLALAVWVQMQAEMTAKPGRRPANPQAYDAALAEARVHGNIGRVVNKYRLSGSSAQRLRNTLRGNDADDSERLQP